jgi:hypothetical protein
MKLFWVTWLLILAAALHLWGDLFYIAVDIKRLMDLGYGAADQSFNRATAWGAPFVRIGASLYYFAYAAMVELLYRIWRRLEANAERTRPQATV